MWSQLNFIPTALTMNSEMPTAGVLAVIIIILSLFALILVVALTTTIIVIVNKKCNSQSQGIRDEVYYSTVGPPLPPVKIEKYMSYEGSSRLEPQWRIVNTEDDKSV